MIKYRINNQIRVPKVMVIDDQGKNLGEMDTSAALALASEKSLDLIEVAPNVKPPVAKIMDFGKYLYQQEKRTRQKKSKQKSGEVKGIRITFRASEHDLGISAEKAKKFLREGYKIRIEMQLRGREKAHKNFAENKFNNFLKMLGEAKLEGGIKKLPSGFMAIITDIQKSTNNEFVTQ